MASSVYFFKLIHFSTPALQIYLLDSILFLIYNFMVGVFTFACFSPNSINEKG
jgi:hypothetical protein